MDPVCRPLYRAAAGLLVLLLTGPAGAGQAGGRFYVAPSGQDTFTGRLAGLDGKGDGPFVTLGRARDAVRQHKAAGKADGMAVGDTHPQTVPGATPPEADHWERAAGLALTITGIALGVVALVAGFTGCVLPMLPGPLLGYLSLLCLQFTGVHDYGVLVLVALGGLSVVVIVVDNVVALLGIKVTGGSKAALVGGGIGVVVGLFAFPPIGIILGPLLGAVIAELIAGNTAKKAFAAGFGSLLGFLCGTLMKTVVTTVIAGFFIWGLVMGA